MIGYFAEVSPSGEYIQCTAVEFPLQEPVTPCDPNNAMHPVDGPPVKWTDRTPTEVLHLIDGEEKFVETSALELLKTKAIARTYVDVDAVYDAAVGSRTVEYTRAEAAARAYLAAEVKPSPASIYITSHALSNPTGLVQSEAWAAQQIVEKADAFNWAVGHMRDARAAHQGNMRASTTPEQLAVAVASWEEFINWLRTTLGLPPR